MNAYCTKSSIDVETVNFMFDGVRLRGEQTPTDVSMEDQDEIQVVIHQVRHTYRCNFQNSKRDIQKAITRLGTPTRNSTATRCGSLYESATESVLHVCQRAANAKV